MFEILRCVKVRLLKFKIFVELKLMSLGCQVCAQRSPPNWLAIIAGGAVVILMGYHYIMFGRLEWMLGTFVSSEWNKHPLLTKDTRCFYRTFFAVNSQMLSKASSKLLCFHLHITNNRRTSSLILGSYPPLCLWPRLQVSMQSWNLSHHHPYHHGTGIFTYIYHKKHLNVGKIYHIWMVLMVMGR